MSRRCLVTVRCTVRIVVVTRAASGRTHSCAYPRMPLPPVRQASSSPPPPHHRSLVYSAKSSGVATFASTSIGIGGSTVLSKSEKRSGVNSSANSSVSNSNATDMLDQMAGSGGALPWMTEATTTAKAKIRYHPCPMLLAPPSPLA